MPKKRMPPNSKAHAVPIVGRLAWRLAEWMELTGTSRQTVWRQIKRGDLRVVYIGAMPMVPRAEAVRLGFIKK